MPSGLIEREKQFDMLSGSGEIAREFERESVGVVSCDEPATIRGTFGNPKKLLAQFSRFPAVGSYNVIHPKAPDRRKELDLISDRLRQFVGTGEAGPGLLRGVADRQAQRTRESELQRKLLAIPLRRRGQRAQQLEAAPGEDGGFPMGEQKRRIL